MAAPSAFNTSEYRRSDGPSQHNAASAWASGHTGDGVTIAVIDTGIDLDNPEFAGRLSNASTDIFGTRPVEGPDDHGNLVSLVAAAARDNTGILGIAYDATVLAIRADTPGSCGGDNAEDPSTDCTFSNTAIANSIDYAVANAAKVINISLGGEGGLNQALRVAIDNAVANGVLIIVAAGNDGRAELTNFGSEFAARGNGGVLIVGSVDKDYGISDFSNKAGANPDFYIAARGEEVCCVYENGEILVETIDGDQFVYLFSGTSFASPQVAGAAALLAQAFPNLTGAEIAEILLRSAFDAGATGEDPVFGQGIMDINRAFQPIGTTTLAAATTAFALSDTSGIASPAMGDAFRTASLPAVITDEFDRAFETNLAGTLRGAEVPQRLNGALAGNARHVGGGTQAASVAFSIDASGAQPPRAQALQLTSEQSEAARVLAARVAMQIAPGTQFGFAYRQGADGLVATLQGQERPAFMIARDAAGESGMIARSDTAFALRHRLGDWGLTVSAQTGVTITAAEQRRTAQLLGRRAEEDLASFGLSFDRDFGDFDTALGLTWTMEDNTVLGARFHEGFGIAGSDTLFVDAEMGWRIADGWRLGGAYRQGFTRVADAPLLADNSQIGSNAWSLDIQRVGVFAGADRMALRISQPLRVQSGGLNLNLPVAYDYETLTAEYGLRTLSLTPQGREMTGELSWIGQLWGGSAAASLFYRRDPGHFETVPDDMGVGLRWSRDF
ncbi:S8 family peptidase [Aurantiacibacter gangjinensis]|uniref:S8 family peptidase n=1 Tax=Aurantiacibacter gangjinensis TaxID=502682 RepID=UPI00069986AA|nr:S8 family peptidase [Aurantiacibacter gangjinensis]